MKRIGSIVLLGVIFTLPSLAAEPKPLERVPKDAALFAHIRVREMMESNLIKEFLKSLDPKIQSQISKELAFEKNFGHTLADLESLTIVLPRLTENHPFESGYVVVVTQKPYDKKKLIQNLKRKEEKNPIDPKAPQLEIPKKAQQPAAPCQPAEPAVAQKLPEHVLPLELYGWNMVFVGEREFILVSDHALDSVLNLKVKEVGPHSASLKKAASDRYLAVVGYHPAAGVEESIPPDVKADVKPYLDALLPAHGELTLTMKKGIELDGIWTYTSEEKAKQGHESIQKSLELFHDELEDALRSNRDEFLLELFGKSLKTQLKAVKPKTEGKTVQFSLTLPIEDPKELSKRIAEEIDTNLPRTTSMNNLKQIMIALHNYESAFTALPAAAICDKEGKPLLSWRVAILPFIEEENLYKQFKLDEPWDSKNNKPLIEKMPKIYLMPGEQDKAGFTRYRVFVGKDAAFDYKKQRGFATITDGSSNTGAVFESADPVIWTKPDEMEFDMKKTTTKSLYFDKKGKSIVAMFDGSVSKIDKKVLDKCLGILVCPNDGQVLPELRENPVPDRGLPAPPPAK